MAPPPVDPAEFDSGAASLQRIEGGDAWIEFEAKEAETSHILGVSNADIPVEGLKRTQIFLALSLNRDMNNIYVLTNGLNGASVGQYSPEKRFRLVIKDMHDGTATVSYVRLTKDDCKAGEACPGDEIAQSEGPIPYPLRVYAMFRERPAQLTNVTMVYIKEPQK